MGLRDYQQEAIKSVVDGEKDGCINQLLVLPCGCGKTVVASNLPAALDMPPWNSLLFLCHRDELALQSVAEFREANPGPQNYGRLDSPLR